MVEQGPRATLHSPEVPITSIGPDTSMRAPLGMEYNNRSPKNIEDYTRKSVHIRYGRTRSLCNTSIPEGTNY
jgi:hypothetical protein